MGLRLRDKFVIYFLLSLLTVFALFPLYWMIASSVRPYMVVIKVPPVLFSTELDFSAYEKVLVGTPFVRMIFNSLFVSTVTTVITVIFSAMAAHSLARLQFRGKKIVTRGVLLAYIFPQILLVLPLYVMLVQAGLSNSFFGLIITYMTFSFPVLYLDADGVLFNHPCRAGRGRSNRRRKPVQSIYQNRVTAFQAGAGSGSHLYVHPRLERIFVRPGLAEFGIESDPSHRPISTHFGRTFRLGSYHGGFHDDRHPHTNRVSVPAESSGEWLDGRRGERLSMKKSIFFTHAPNDFDLFFCAEALDRLAADIDVRFNPLERHLTERELLEFSAGSDIIISEWWTAPSNTLLSNKPDLLAFIRVGVEIKDVDYRVADQNRVMIVNAPDMQSLAVVEFILCLIFALSRDLIHFHNKTVSKFYRESFNEALSAGTIRYDVWPQFEISGKILGIIGLGSVGRMLAARAHPLGMKILAYDPYCREIADHVEMVELDDLLSRSKFVSVCALLTEETENLIAAQQLNKMSRDAYLINTARGGIVDSAALEHALATNRIAGAALDVVDTEPNFAASSLLRLDNVIITPHIAGHTKETVRRLSECVVRSVNEIYAKKIPAALINKSVVPKFS